MFGLNSARAAWVALLTVLLFAELGATQYAGASFEADTGESLTVRDTKHSEAQPAVRAKRNRAKDIAEVASELVADEEERPVVEEEVADLPEAGIADEEPSVEEEAETEESLADAEEPGDAEEPVDAGEESSHDSGTELTESSTEDVEGGTSEFQGTDESGLAGSNLDGIPDGISSYCGTEPHSDVGGFAVVFGIGHRQPSAGECCQACQDHAEKSVREGRDKPCNSWVFCPEPVCWGLDTGWNHTFGECWLKWQEDPENPIYGQRGLYTEEFHTKFKHIRGGPPKAVPWMGGVLGQEVDRSKKWMTGPKGIQAASGEKLRVWRAWLNDFEPDE